MVEWRSKKNITTLLEFPREEFCATSRCCKGILVRKNQLIVDVI